MAGPWEKYATPAAPSGPWSKYGTTKPEAPSVVEDVAKSGGSGLVRGVTGLMGLPSAAASWLSSTSDFLAEKITGEPVPEKYKRNTVADALSTDTLNRVVDRAADAPVTSYKPQTTVGEYARTIGEFASGAAVPGGLASRAANVLVPAIASETAGQLTEGSAIEPYARAGGAIVGGIGTAMASRPSTAQGAIREAAGTIDDATLARAGQMMNEATQRGVPLTWPEALAQVGAPSRLNDVQRVVEGSGGMRDFMATRAAGVQNAGPSAFNQIGARSNPSELAFDLRDTSRAIIAESPEGQALAENVWRAGPRTTAEDAGQIIQPQLDRVYQGREGMRAALADADYSAARNAPANIPVGGGYGIRNVHSVYDVPEIPILTDPTARQAATAQRNAAQSQFADMPVIGLQPERFAQVDPAPVASAIEGMLQTAKGTPARALEAARRALQRPDGTLDDTVAGLDASRKAITDLIDEAARNGQKNTTAQLQEALAQLDGVLEAVPAYGQARRGFAAASKPLEAFAENRVPGQIVQRDQYGRDFQIPPDQATRALERGGPQAARDFNQVAPPQSREAFENYLTTQVLDTAGRNGLDVSSDAIRTALRQNEDTLRQYPNVVSRLEAVATSRDALAKIEASPIGRMATKDPDTRKAINALFPRDPLAGSTAETAATVAALAKKRPAVAEQLVRTHLETVFNQSTRNLTSGANEFGGAKFAAAIKGNAEQAAMLEAAVKALPNGAERWQGFNRFLDVMEATGQRQRIGSQTEFNRELRQQLSTGKVGGEATALVGGGVTQIPARLREAYQNYRYGRNVNELAAILTDPKAAPLLRALTKGEGGLNSRNVAIATRLTALGGQTKAATESRN